MSGREWRESGKGTRRRLRPFSLNQSFGSLSLLEVSLAFVVYLSARFHKTQLSAEDSSLKMGE